jgi:hypothetical protein
VEAVDQIGNGQGTHDKNKLLEPFLLGNISDLLYEIKCLAKSTSATKSVRIKTLCIQKLKQILERYHNLLGRAFKESISKYINDSFKSRKIFRHDLRKIHAWWLKDSLKINN